MMHKPPPSPEADDTAIARAWWKEAVVYQVYPRSFADSDGDGVGDLAGITAHLDHIADLGVDVIWLSPHYQSPFVDNGYDISDYRAVSPLFGTMKDFDTLLAQVKARGMKLIIDLVVNHTSDQHAWFADARKSRTAEKRDFYIWRDGTPDAPPNDWQSFFSTPAWTWDDATQAWYLHLFAREQPDLNWDNPAVREEVYDIMRFWLDKGVDGFRMDVIPFISKPADLPENDKALPWEQFYAEGPKLHEYLKEMRQEVLDHYDCMTVGEGNGLSVEQMGRMVDARRGELDTIFQFDVINFLWGREQPRTWTLPEFKRVLRDQSVSVRPHGWNTVFLSNHDTPRALNRYGDPDPAWRQASAKVLHTLILTQPGTPYIYQGDELGMSNYPFTALDQFDDIAVRQGWAKRQAAGETDPSAYLAELNIVSRDHTRTPMQWDDGPNAGFTQSGVTPWLPVHPDHATINAKAAWADPQSACHAIAKLTQLRRDTPSMVYGDYTDLAPDHPELLIYRRWLAKENEGALVALNFSRKTLTWELPKSIHIQGVAYRTDNRANVDGGKIKLGGWSGIVLAL
ncbi:alpha-glucosidase [Marivivens niveibacter]|nr:alpha-glucosidase [Marivivens niveibacter]